MSGIIYFAFNVSIITNKERLVKTHLDGLLRGVPRRSLDWSLGLQAHRCTITARHPICCNKNNKY